MEVLSPAEEAIKLLMIISSFICLISTLLFTRTSMKSIERKMLAERVDIPWWDEKGWGFRISIFVSVLARGKQSKVPVLADEAILKHARSYDRFLALIVSVSFMTCMIPGFYFVFVLGL